MKETCLSEPTPAPPQNILYSQCPSPQYPFPFTVATPHAVVVEANFRLCKLLVFNSLPPPTPALGYFHGAPLGYPLQHTIAAPLHSSALIPPPRRCTTLPFSVHLLVGLMLLCHCAPSRLHRRCCGGSPRRQLRPRISRFQTQLVIIPQNIKPCKLS